MKFIIFDDEKTAVEISKIVEHMQHTILQWLVQEAVVEK